jgi:hypothetical protein
MTVYSKHPARCAIVALGLALLNPIAARAYQTDPCPNMAAPAGAKKLGYTNKVFCVAPTTNDVSVSDTVPNKLYSGHWFSHGAFPMSMFSDEQALVLAPGAVVTTETRKSKPGLLPLIPASSGFYVEFDERISDNDPDHWPAVWLMPQEHNNARADHLASDPPNFERWLELDVDEGGFNKTGHHGAAHSWQGIYPNFTRQSVTNRPVSSPPMDRSQYHVFGLGYDPDHSTVTWWVDGIETGSASIANSPTYTIVPEFIKTHHYYLIMSNQTHGMNVPYKMYIRYFAVWSGTPVPNPPSGVHTGTNP